MKNLSIASIISLFILSLSTSVFAQSATGEAEYETAPTSKKRRARDLDEEAAKAENHEAEDLAPRGFWTPKGMGIGAAGLFYSGGKLQSLTGATGFAISAETEAGRSSWYSLLGKMDLGIIPSSANFKDGTKQPLYAFQGVFGQMNAGVRIYLLAADRAVIRPYINLMGTLGIFSIKFKETPTGFPVSDSSVTYGYQVGTGFKVRVGTNPKPIYLSTEMFLQTMIGAVAGNDTMSLGHFGLRLGLAW